MPFFDLAQLYKTFLAYRKAEKSQKIDATLPATFFSIFHIFTPG
jgi:hypothetical protein